MNEIIINFLWTRDKCIPKLHLRLPGFTYSACRLFTKDHERIQKFTEAGYLNYMHKNELDKTCFTPDTTYADSKNLAKTVTDKILKNRAYEIALNTKHGEYQRGLWRKYGA